MKDPQIQARNASEWVNWVGLTRVRFVHIRPESGAARPSKRRAGNGGTPAILEPSNKPYGAYHAYPRRGNLLGRAVRTQRYRLVEWKQFGASTESAEYELYDYTDDPSETVNLASRRPSIVAALEAMLARHREPLPPHK